MKVNAIVRRASGRSNSRRMPDAALVTTSRERQIGGSSTRRRIQIVRKAGRIPTKNTARQP